MSVDVTGSRERIAAFLSEQPTCVLATADQQGKPHAATVYFTCDHDLNLYFITKVGTQKHRNLQVNPQAAVAISNTPSQTTVQAAGSVVEITDHRQLEWIFDAIWRLAAQTANNLSPPPMAKLTAGGYVVYRLSSPSLRMATFNSKNVGETPQDNIFEVVNTQPSLTNG